MTAAVNLGGGTIDNTVIGATDPASGALIYANSASFTNLSASGGVRRTVTAVQPNVTSLGDLTS